MARWRLARALGGRATEGLLGEVNRRAPGRSLAADGGIGDAAHAGRTSDHNPHGCCGVVLARDFTHDPRGGFDAEQFTAWLRQRVQEGERRVKYVIWNGKIFSGWGQSHAPGQWREYTGTNPHRTHVHVSVHHDLADDDAPWGWAT